jgi:hypothetical protein
MILIHTHIPKAKKRKPTKKQRELQASWEAMLAKYPTKSLPKNVAMPKPQPAYHRETVRHPSLNSGLGNATLKPSKVYTGTLVKGIATMHKSNAVPVFSNEEAVEISKMRRG